jgi:hypothetical protein
VVLLVEAGDFRAAGAPDTARVRSPVEHRGRPRSQNAVLPDGGENSGFRHTISDGIARSAA